MPAYLYFDASGFGAAATPDKKNLEETLECELAAWPQVTPHALRVQAQKIQFWLEMLESRAADCAAIAWRERFADERYIHADHNVPSPGDVISRLDPSGEALKLVCCRGLYFYLKNGERFQLFHANLLRLYAAWQWYHLVKERLTNPDCQKQPAWVDEMGTAYRELWQTLHLEEVRAHNTLVHLVAASNQDAKVRTPDLLERLRLQMVMEAPAAGGP